MADLDAMADKARPKIERALASLMRDIIARYEADNIAALPGDARDRVEDMLRDVYRTAAQMGGEPMIEGMKDCFPHLERKQDMDELFDEIIEAFLEQFGAQKVVQIAETTRKQIMRLIQEGQREGLGVQAIAKELREAIPSLSRYRSAVIARTETHASSQYAQLRVAQTSTRPLNKRWSSVEDARTRDFGEGDGEDDEFNHRAMHGQVVAMEQPFLVDTIFGTREPLMYPGDPNGSAGNVINCRCSMTFRRADRA